MATVEKIRKDIEKTKEKISAQQKRLRELEAQLTEEENLEIVRMVKAVRMDNKELTAFLKAYASGLITLPVGMMEAEAMATITPVSYTHLDVYKRQIWGCMGYTALLCYTLFKTGSLAKSLFGAH